MNMSQLENTADTMLSQVWGFMHDIAEDFFIGYSDREKEGDWKWVDNSDLFWIHWDDQQPDGGTQENCAFMDIDTGFWHDVSCGVRSEDDIILKL